MFVVLFMISSWHKFHLQCHSKMVAKCLADLEPTMAGTRRKTGGIDESPRAPA